MKNKILLFVFIAFAFIASAKCPTSVSYSSPSFTFTFPGSTPSGTYNQLRVTISSGTGSGNSYILTISSNSGTTIVTDNASGSVDGSSVASKIEYYLSGSPTSVADCNQNTPLPVTLISFNGKLLGDKVKLTWATATEINNDKFIVERSEDGKSFVPIGVVPGNGNSNQIIGYEFLDMKHPGGFYRLKQIDYNGEFEYSNSIKIVMVSEKAVTFFPNPCYDKLNLILPEFEGAVQILSLDGKIIIDSNERILDTESLKPGVYILRVGSFTYKVAKS